MPCASELRARARAQMGNRIFGEKWLLLLVAALLADAVLGLTYFFAFILVGPISIGLAAVFLRQVRSSESPVRLEELLYSFREGRFARSLILGLLSNIFIFLWSLLFIIPGIVKYYSYSMAYYIQLDNPDMDANTCITESRRIMNGHKWQLFCLDISFIGWIIVGALACGIGTLWVAPYIQMARANFYDELIRQPEVVAN